MTTIPRDISVSKLDATEAFNGLTATEKLYAYHIGKASWEVSQGSVRSRALSSPSDSSCSRRRT